MSAETNSGSEAPFYIDKLDRKSDDGLHQEEPDDLHAYHEANIQWAMADGIGRGEAFRIDGPKGVTLAEHDAEMAPRADRARRVSPAAQHAAMFDEVMKDR